jgi:hypothetical protein
MSEEAPSLDLSALDFRPAWAKEPSSASAPVRDREPREENRGPRPDRGDRRPPRPGGFKRGGPPRKEGFHGSKDRPKFQSPSRDERPAPPPNPFPWLRIAFTTTPPAVETVVKQVRQTGKTYSLFDIARILLRNPASYTLDLTSAPKPEEGPFHLAPDGSVWMSRENAVRHILRTNLGDFYRAEEIESAAELKTAADLLVPLPAENLDFNHLARAASASLPRRGTATREQLAALVHYQPHAVTAPPSTTETRGDTTAAFYALRVADTWTVPVVALTRGIPRSTTLLVADAGRKSLAARTEALLAAGQRVLAVDPFYFGESKITQRDFLYALLVAATGDRPLGLQSSQLAALARWARTEFKSPAVTLESHGPRLGLAALVATALEPTAIATLHQTDALPSLHEVIRQNWSVDQKPELFCFGLLEHFDVPQLQTLVGSARLK